MIKKKKGIGFVKLVIGIIVIVVVAIIGISYVRKEIDKEKTKNVQADLLLVQAKIEMARGNYNIDKENSHLKGYRLDQLPENINIQEFFDKNIIEQDEYEKYYLLDEEDLRQYGLGNLVSSYDGYFIVNYDNYDVIYTKGYKNSNGLWCYKISDLNKMPEIQQSVPLVAGVKDENGDKTEDNQEVGDNDETTKETEESFVSSEENSNNQNINKNVIYNEVSAKIKEIMIVIQEKNKELSVLVQ